MSDPRSGHRSADAGLEPGDALPDRAGSEAARTGLDRRELLRLGALGGVLLATPSLAAPQATGGTGPIAGTTDAAPAFELEEATIDELQRQMASGEHTARSLAEAYIERIEALDRRGPELRAVLEINPEALDIADRLDRERKEKGARGPLHGVPILIKDNIATADRMETTAGSLALLGAKAARDSFVAERLRQAGAVLLGKTNLSEWANFRSTHSSSGWSGRGGQCRNPYALDRSPSGSSSGSGVAAAANLCAAAVGTETDGSITSPSTCNALVGVKPTVGRVSRAGIVPISHSQDTAGPMTRTVRDAAILLAALSGEDPADPATRESHDMGSFDPASGLETGAFKGARIGVVRQRWFGYSPAVDRIGEAALEAMKGLGAVVVDPVEIATAGELDDDELEVLLYEFKTDLDRYLEALGPGAPVGSLAQAIEFNRANRDREMPYFGQEIFEMAMEKGPLTDPAYTKARERNVRRSRKQGLDRVMDEHRLDALVAPTGAPPWLIDLVDGDHFLGGCTTFPAVAGYPHVTVPGGWVFGLPVGISLIGRAWSEAKLLRLAYAFEQETRHRRPPRFLATADLSSG